MDESAEAQEGAGTGAGPNGTLPDVVVIAPKGDVVLDVLFETSRETLRAVRKATQPRPGRRPGDAAATRPVLKPKLRVAYRVDGGVLKKQSKYFQNLLGDTRFEEARAVADALAAMSLRNARPEDLPPPELPWVRIEDDDEASRAAGREVVFAELLRIVHGVETLRTAKNPPKLPELATLAVLADRFDCIRPASAYLKGLRFRFPQATVAAAAPAASGEDGAMPGLVNEEAVRQKILVAWLLDQPLRFHSGTRELILHGSRRWSAYAADEEQDKAYSAAWWDLPDDLERELQTRRECIMNCLASVQRHFLGLYTSRERQCKLGYGSSASCDSFQLGEMVKFLAHRDLLFLVDFSSQAATAGGRGGGGGGGGGGGDVRDFAAVDVYHVLATLKQCPAYQIDANHTNCGLRTRLLPILEYIQSMLSSAVVGVARPAWKGSRAATAWVVDDGKKGGDGGEDGGGVFLFTRSLASDQRLRYEGAMAADRMARQLFTAREWNWTPES